jgi:hypothetical protein
VRRTFAHGTEMLGWRRRTLYHDRKAWLEVLARLREAMGR